MAKINKGTASLIVSGDQPFVLVNDGPDNSGTFTITLNDPQTGATISTLAHLADSYDTAKTPYFLPLQPAALIGRVLVCTGILKRVGVDGGPLVFRLQVIQGKRFAYDGPIQFPKVDLQTFAYRIVFTQQP